MNIDLYIGLLKDHCKNLDHEEMDGIAQWLEELKDYRDKNKMVCKVDVMNMDELLEKVKEAYNQALEDFYKALEKKQQADWIDNLEYGITFADVEEVIKQLKK